MKTTVVEPWVRLLREYFNIGAGGKQTRLPVQVSIGFPFTDLPEKSNLMNNPSFADAASAGVVQDPNRRNMMPPEITVHDVGERINKKYMDNFISNLYSRDVKIDPIFADSVIRVKNVMFEDSNGLTILEENKDYIYDSVRKVISFHLERFNLLDIGSYVHYALELKYETYEPSGNSEIILTGQIVQGEMIGILHSLETDVTLQIDLWGGNTKQCEWLLQKFRELWIDERGLRQRLSGLGLINMNLGWSHGGIVPHLDTKYRPYLYNISCHINFNTEYRLLKLARQYVTEFNKRELESWLGTIDMSFDVDGVAMRKYIGAITMAPFDVSTIVMMDEYGFNGGTMAEKTPPWGMQVI